MPGKCFPRLYYQNADVPAVSSAFSLFLFPDGKSKIKTGRLYWEFPKNNFLPNVRS
jgi:hypothetical protein